MINRISTVLILLSLIFIRNTFANTLYAKTSGGNWSSANTWSTTSAAGADNSGPPSASTDVIFELLSGNVTINSASSCRSLDTTSGTGTYGGTITHNAFTLAIGDGTAGAGNVAFKLNSGMGYTLSSATLSAVAFVSSSATQQTITTAGKTLGNITVNAASGKYQLSDGMTSSGNFSMIGANTFDTNSQIITLNGADITFTGGSRTYYQLSLTGSGSATLSGTNTFTNLERSGTAVKTDGFILSNDQTVTGVFTLAGNSTTNRLVVVSNTAPTTRTITNSGATMTWSNVDFRDIGLGTSYDCSAISGLCGDEGGNVNITFTSSQQQFWYRNTGSWSDATKWFTSTGGSGTGRVPLPQDDVRFDSNSFSSGSQTITSDMPRWGRTISWSGVTNTPTWSGFTANPQLFGGLTLGTMTFSPSGTINFLGRGAYTLSGTNNWLGANISVNAPGGSLTLGTALNFPGTLFLFRGTFDAAGFAVSITNFNGSGTLTRVLNMGSGVWSLLGSAGTTWDMTTTTGLTINPSTSTISNYGTSASTKTFIGGSKTYNNIRFTSGSGAYIITGSNTFNVFTIDPLRTVQFIAGTTTTISRLVSMGTSTGTVTISSATAATHTLSIASGLVCQDYMTITNSIASGGAIWYAGNHSTNVSGNTGWKFLSCGNRQGFMDFMPN